MGVIFVDLAGRYGNRVGGAVGRTFGGFGSQVHTC